MKRDLSLYITTFAIVALGSAVFLTLFLSPATNAEPPVFPTIIALPDGFRPEGIAVGRGTDFFVGSLADGAIYAGDLRTGQGGILVQGQEGQIAVGLSFDKRSSFLFAAAGPMGSAYVYDTATGAEVAWYQLIEVEAFVNDVVVTSDAAYFTDSFRPFFYRLPLGPDGSLPDQADVEDLPLGGDFEFVPDEFNANGIEATPDGKWLLIVNSVLGTLYRVDPNSGYATIIDLGGEAVPSGDGLVLDGKTLYVVQNFLNQIAVVKLDPDLTSGVLVEHITHPNFRIPTTAADFGNALYAVNARFDVEPGPDVEYEAVRVEIDRSSRAPGLNHGRAVTTMWGGIKTSH